MAEMESNTHGMIVAGAGGTAAADALIGTITLPAGGPWLIHDVFAQVVDATATAAEAPGGAFRIEVASGDLTPNPAPSRFPARGRNAFLGATADRSKSPLSLFPVAYEAAGKAVINLYGTNHNTVTVAPQWVIGMLFGKSRPELLPLNFCDVITGSVTAAAATALGTVTLAEKATKIVGICGTLFQSGVVVAGEELIGFFSLSSDDVKLQPMQLPFNEVWGAGLGALIDGQTPEPPSFIPVDIPVTGGARINATVDLNTAVTNTTAVAIHIAYI